MSLTRRIAHNTAIQTGGKLIGTVLSLFAAGILFRYLGDDNFGKYTTIVAFLQIFGILMDLGLYIVLVKKIARIDDVSAPVVNNIFTLRVISGVILLGLAPLVAWIVSQYSDKYTTEIVTGVGITTLFFFFISMNQLLSAVFQKFLRSDWIALGEFIGKVVLLGATILFVVLEVNLLVIMLTLVLSSGANFVVNFLASRKYFKIQFAFDWKMCKEILRDAWPIGVSIAFGIIYFKGDTFILTFYEPDYVVGWYGAPYKILEVLVTFPAMFTGLALPVLTSAWQEKNMERLKRVLQKSFDALVIVAVPMVAGTVVLAPYIMQLLAGNEFAQSVEVLQILIIATGTIFLGTLFGYVVPAIDKQRTMMWGYGVVALTSLVGYLYFIPRYSIHGAAWMTVYSELLVVLIAVIIVIRTTRIQLQLHTALKSILSSAVMYGVLSWLLGVMAIGVLTHLSATAQAILYLTIFVPIGALVYFLSMIVLRGIRKQDIKEIITLRSNG